MTRYHLFKGTRGYAGHAYCGPSNDGQPAQADTLEEALDIRARLMVRNPGVGWGIHDLEAGSDVPLSR
jgi:hypothetical protein